MRLVKLLLGLLLAAKSLLRRRQCGKPTLESASFDNTVYQVVFVPFWKVFSHMGLKKIILFSIGEVFGRPWQWNTFPKKHQQYNTI